MVASYWATRMFERLENEPGKSGYFRIAFCVKKAKIEGSLRGFKISI